MRKLAVWILGLSITLSHADGMPSASSADNEVPAHDGENTAQTEFDRLSEEIRLLQMQNYWLRQQMEYLSTQQALDQLKNTQDEDSPPAMLAIMRVDGRWQARLKTADGTFYTAGLNDRVDGWKIVKINDNGVWGKRNGEIRQFPDVVKTKTPLPDLFGPSGPDGGVIPPAPPAPPGAFQ